MAQCILVRVAKYANICLCFLRGSGEVLLSFNALCSKSQTNHGKYNRMYRTAHPKVFTKLFPGNQCCRESFQRHLTESSDLERPRPNAWKSEKYGSKGKMILVLCNCDFRRGFEVPVMVVLHNSETILKSASAP